MKRIISLITVLMSLSTFAMAEPLKLYGGGVQSKNMKDLSNRICGELIRSNGLEGLSAPDAFRNSIARYLESPSTRQKVIAFWNVNKKINMYKSKPKIYQPSNSVETNYRYEASRRGLF